MQPNLSGVPSPSDLVSDDGVHINSGIPNRAFALAANALGGHSWVTVGPVWYAVMVGNKVGPNATFKQFAQATIDAALTSEVANAISAAWRTVKVL